MVFGGLTMINVTHRKRINACKQRRMENIAKIMYIVGAILFVVAIIVGYTVSHLICCILAITAFIVVCFGMETKLLSGMYEE